MLWCAMVFVPLVVVSILVARRPDAHTVTTVYRQSVINWETRSPLYDGTGGMHYLPTFMPLFVPFYLMPQVLGDVLWRCLGWGALVLGIWRLTRQGIHAERDFALATLLALPLCLGALRNGQANAHLGAALLLAAVCLAAERWWAAIVFVCLSVAIKQVGLAAAGLVLAAYPRLWWRLAVGLAITFLFPFACGPAHYVARQFADNFDNLRQCAAETENRFADINGILRAVHAPLGGDASLLVRGAAGLALAIFCLLVIRRLARYMRALAWLACAAGYLMLFNPLTEGNSYVALAPALALWTIWLFNAHARATGWVLAAATLSMALAPTLLRPWLGNSSALVWFPLMAILFLCIVLRWCLVQTAEAARRP